MIGKAALSICGMSSTRLRLRQHDAGDTRRVADAQIAVKPLRVRTVDPNQDPVFRREPCGRVGAGRDLFTRGNGVFQIDDHSVGPARVSFRKPFRAIARHEQIGARSGHCKICAWSKDRAADSEEIAITRHDKPAAQIIAEGRESLAAVRDAVAGLRELSARWRSAREYNACSTDAELKAAVDKGRPASAAFVADALCCGSVVRRCAVRKVRLVHDGRHPDLRSLGYCSKITTLGCV